MFKKPNFTPFLAVVVLMPALIVAGCSADVQAPDQNPMPQDTLRGPGMFSGEGGDILGAFRKKDNDGGASLGVNGYLWRATLDTISFMPIVQADSAGGIIVTDWYNNPKLQTERYRMNVFIRGRVLRADAVKVEVFKQLKKSGDWVDVEVTRATETSLEDTILTKARSLRVADKVAK